ncbi:MAG: hypothetical protein Q4F80_03775, partial [bacterium]|nr:hypothetical protein [bacterium]
VSVLNSAITMNMALDGESPYDNADLFRYLQRHMSVLKSTYNLPFVSSFIRNDGTKVVSGKNAAFYTTDGMRFEFEDSPSFHLKLHESDQAACLAITDDFSIEQTQANCGGCGSLGLDLNPNNTTKPPCAVLVDVNGDRKPNPKNYNEYSKDKTNDEVRAESSYKFPEPDSKTVNDLFIILITEDRAFPYGVVAQRAMYNAAK